jgi:hypothetical protein
MGNLLDWTPGSLKVDFHGAWVILQADPSETTSRRNNGSCSYLDDRRVRITHAVCANLGLTFGAEVALLPLPAQGALALTNPARLLLGAPLEHEWIGR